MPVDVDSRIGTELAGYRIEALIGRGGMSTVYRAEDLTLGRKVALKLISPELAEDERFRERFRAEWRLAASIDHPNVIPIHEAGESDGTLFIAMRYVEGTDLKVLLEEEGALEPPRALNLVSQAAAGLDAAHDRGLVHRDVKPSNVLISFDRDGEHAYLADFGLTKPASNEEEARESIQLSGTTDYVSPEQIADGTADARSDTYALGALLYECLTGEVPYLRDRKLQVLFAHVNDPPPKPTDVRPELPEAIDGVIDTAMAKEPEDRYRTGVELAEAATAAFPEARRPRWQIAAFVGVLALLIAAALVVPAILLTGGGAAESGGVTEVSTPSIQRIDPQTGELAATLAIDVPAEGLAASADAVWIASAGDRAVLKIDPSTSSLVQRIPSEAGLPKHIGADDDRVWVLELSGGLRDSLTSIDPETGDAEEVTTFLHPNFAPFGVRGFAAGEGAVWIGNDEPSVVMRIDAESHQATETELPFVSGPFDVGNGAIWIVHAISDLPEIIGLTRLEPTSGLPEQTVELEFFPRDVAAGAGSVWLANRRANAVMRLDPSTMEISSSVAVRSPAGLATTPGAVWATNDRDGTVSRIDAESLDVRTIDVGGIPTHIAANEDGVWVTVRPR